MHRADWDYSVLANSKPFFATESQVVAFVCDHSVTSASRFVGFIRIVDAFKFTLLK